MNITTENKKWLEDFNLNHPLVLAGPCSAETEEQIAALPSHIDQFVFEGEPVL